MPNEGLSHDHQGHDAKRQKPQPQEQATHGLEGPGQTVVEAAVAYQRAATAPPPAIRPEDILSLQRTVGNEAVGRILAERNGTASAGGPLLKPFLQAKLTVNPPGDSYEREADRMAGKVMGRISATRTESAQRQEKEEGVPVQARTAGKAGSEVGGYAGDWVQRGPDDDDEGGGKKAVGKAKGVAEKAIRKLPVGPPLRSEKELQADIRKAEDASKGQPEVIEFEVAIVAGLGESGEGLGGRPPLERLPHIGMIEAEGMRAKGHEKWASAQEYGGRALEMAEYAGELGGSQLATSGKAGVELAGKALGWIGVAFGAISAFFDLKSLISTGRKRKELKEVLDDAEAQFGADPQDKAQQEVKGFILYAMEQKYRKWWKRLISFLSSVAAAAVAVPALIAGVSLAALASNPVGWVVAGVIAIAAAVAGVGLLFHRIWRWCKKGKRRGAERLRRAGTIFEHFRGVAGTLKDLAGRAIGSLLGRDKWDEMSEEYDRAPEGQKEAKGATIIKLIARKLKST